MIVSRNEIHGVVRKAALGAGLSAGTADDLANATSWMEARGLGGLTLALDDIQNGGKQAQAYASICDRIAAGEGHVQSERAGQLLIGFAADGAAAYDLGFVIEWTTRQVEVGKHGYKQTGGGPTGPAMVRAGAQPKATPKLDEIVIERDVWTRANKMAAAYYVPATDASRLGGAGAGVNDND